MAQAVTVSLWNGTVGGVPGVVRVRPLHALKAMV